MKKMVTLIMGAIISMLLFIGCTGNVQEQDLETNLLGNGEIKCPELSKVPMCKDPKNLEEGESVSARCQLYYDYCPHLNFTRK